MLIIVCGFVLFPFSKTIINKNCLFQPEEVFPLTFVQITEFLIKKNKKTLLKSLESVNHCFLRGV